MDHGSKSQTYILHHVKKANEKARKWFTRDVRNVGHWGMGELEIAIRSDDDLMKAEPLLAKAYEMG